MKRLEQRLTKEESVNPTRSTGETTRILCGLCQSGVQDAETKKLKNGKRGLQSCTQQRNYENKRKWEELLRKDQQDQF